MTSFELREKFFRFFQNKNHTRLPSASLIPQNDPTLLFVNAGMNPFKNIFLGLETPKHEQVTTIQKCLRAGGKHNDIEQVGQTPWHHTFFEMMGFFSFGSYFKKQAIALAWEFLVQELRFPEEHLWVSVFEKDDEAFEIWNKNQNIPTHKILRLGQESNFWQMGDVGPCGPCSEIYYYNGPKSQPEEKDLVEVWNLVFMEYYDTEQKERKKLPQPCVDTGMGLERLTALVQKTTSNYHTDLFKDIILALEKSCSTKYNFQEKGQDSLQMAFRVLADHSRACSFLISDGILPANEGSQYVLRRIIRRALYYSQKLNPAKNLLAEAIEACIPLLSPVYPQLKKDQDLILSLIDQEAKQFFASLEVGRKKLFQKIKTLPQKEIDFETSWDLYSTYGFPVDLTRLIAQEQNYKMIDEATFEKEKALLEKKQKTIVKSSHPIDSLIQEHKSLLLNEKTVFTGYKNHTEQTEILYLFANKHPFSSVTTVKEKEEGWLVARESCFYPEGGGPIGDQGLIKTPTATCEVLDCLKRNQTIFHKIKVIQGKINLPTQATLQVNQKFRSLVATSHSATHLLNASLRKHLGKEVRQAGSLVEPGYLRFDFTYPKPLSVKQLEQLEQDVQTSIQKKEPVQDQTLPFDKALQEGALCLQGENYDHDVRVITVGQHTSKELCGGIHVQNTGEIKEFKILSETGVQSGVRRILAATSSVAHEWEENLKNQMIELKKYLNQKDVESSLENPFLKWEKELAAQTQVLKNQIANLNFSTSPKKETEKLQAVPSLKRHPLAQFNLELRQYLNLPVPKHQESQNPFLSWAEKKQEDWQNLQAQHEALKSQGFNSESLIQQGLSFSIGSTKGLLLVIDLPLKDRNLISEVADQLKSKIKTGVLVILGESSPAHPLVVTVTKDLQNKIPAGTLLKNTLAPIFKGKGGGQARFAQGTATDKSQLKSLTQTLLENFKSL